MIQQCVIITFQDGRQYTGLCTMVDIQRQFISGHLEMTVRLQVMLQSAVDPFEVPQAIPPHQPRLPGGQG